MDTLTTCRHVVKQTLLHYAELRPSHGDIRLDVVFDETHDRYALMQVGWDSGRRVRGNLVYITLHDDKVYVEYDGLERGITSELTSKGIPAHKVILAFLPESPTAAAIAGQASVPNSQDALQTV